MLRPILQAPSSRMRRSLTTSSRSSVPLTGLPRGERDWSMHSGWLAARIGARAAGNRTTHVPREKGREGAEEPILRGYSLNHPIRSLSVVISSLGWLGKAACSGASKGTRLTTNRGDQTEGHMDQHQQSRTRLAKANNFKSRISWGWPPKTKPIAHWSGTEWR